MYSKSCFYLFEINSVIFVKTFSMQTNEVLLGAIFIVLAVLAGGIWIAYAKNSSRPQVADAATKTLQLTAYERLSVLVERIALPALITRVNEPGLSLKEMQMLLTQNIKQEYEYNISQQIYVSSDAWNAIKNLKEQNLLIINQIANTLPPNATGLDLNKKLLDFSLHDKRGSLHELVSEAVSFEAKKIM